MTHLTDAFHVHREECRECRTYPLCPVGHELWVAMHFEARGRSWQEVVPFVLLVLALVISALLIARYVP